MRSLRIFFAPLLVLALASTLPARAQSSHPASDSTSSRSATVAGLLELLEAKMTEDVMLLWLDTRAADEQPPSAADLVALRDAGAGDAVLKKLLALPTVVVPATAEAPTEPVLAPDPAPETSEPPAAATAEETATDSVVVDFTFSYVPDYRADEKEWSLYVYLDGKPLSYVAQGSRLLGEDALRFEQVLKPGRHQIRLAQENHETGRRDIDFHEARMAPVDLVFQLQPGTAEVEVGIKRPLLDFGSDGSVRYRVAQAGRVVLAEDGVGGDPDGWVPVCDDAKAAGLEAPRGCQAWPTFWIVDAPPRNEVLRALKLFEYRPVPKNQKVH